MSFQAGAIQAVMGIDTAPFAQGMLQATQTAKLFPSVVTSFLANPLLGVIDTATKVTKVLAGIFVDSARFRQAASECDAAAGRLENLVWARGVR